MLIEDLRRFGVHQRRVAEATGRDPSDISRQVRGLVPLTPDVRLVCRRLLQDARLRLAREGLEVAQDLLRTF